MKKLKQEAFFQGRGVIRSDVSPITVTLQTILLGMSWVQKKGLPKGGGLGSMTSFLSSVSAPRKTRIVEFPLKGSSCSSPRLMQ